MASELKLPYFETSAKTGENVDEAIHFIVRECLKKITVQSGAGVIPGLNKPQSGHSSGCFGAVKQLFSGILQSRDQGQ